MDRYAVIGNPVEHSKSPHIHRLFAEQTGQKITYGKLLAPLKDFAGTVTLFQADGGKGLNVTLPFKLEALSLCDSVSDRARRAGAVNTISFTSDSQRRGDNTDGVGLVRDISVNHGLKLEGLRVLLLGAGGAARGVLGPLLDSRPASVTIANRTPAKALELANDFGGPDVVAICGFNDLEDRSFDLIINGTSAGLSGETPPLPAEIMVPGGS
jgi:shikimate dehydrogenase